MKPSWRIFLVFATWSATAPVGASDEPPAEFVEVVRVKRDFGKPHFDLVIDAWTDREGERLDEVRLWWANTSEHDRRKPLGRLIERMVKLKYRRLSATKLTVTVTGDGKEFKFTVELGGDGRAHAYVAVDTEDGRHIARCRTHSARLLARRLLGLPVGVSRLTVECRDGHGVVHHGQIHHRDV